MIEVTVCILRKAVWQAFVCSYNTSLFSEGELSPVGCGLFFFGLTLTTEPWHDQTRASPP